MHEKYTDMPCVVQRGTVMNAEMICVLKHSVHCTGSRLVFESCRKMVQSPCSPP